MGRWWRFEQVSSLTEASMNGNFASRSRLQVLLFVAGDELGNHPFLALVPLLWRLEQGKLLFLASCFSVLYGICQFLFWNIYIFFFKSVTQTVAYEVSYLQLSQLNILLM